MRKYVGVGVINNRVWRMVYNRYRDRRRFCEEAQRAFVLFGGCFCMRAFFNKKVFGR